MQYRGKGVLIRGTKNIFPVGRTSVMRGLSLKHNGESSTIMKLAIEKSYVPLNATILCQALTAKRISSASHIATLLGHTCKLTLTATFQAR